MELVAQFNFDYSFLTHIKWKKAMKHLYKGKAEVLEEEDGRIKSIRLIKYIRRQHRGSLKYSKRNIHIRDMYICQYCGEFGNTIDHVIPRSKGGKSTFENTVCACRDCNRKKDDRLASEAGMYLKRKPVHPTIMEFFLVREKYFNKIKIL